MTELNLMLMAVINRLTSEQQVMLCLFVAPCIVHGLLYSLRRIK